MYVAAGFIEDHDHIAVPELGGCCYQLEVGDDVLEIVRALDVAADGDEASGLYAKLAECQCSATAKWEILDLNQ